MLLSDGIFHFYISSLLSPIFVPFFSFPFFLSLLLFPLLFYSIYLYLRASRDVVLSPFAGRGERSFERNNNKKKKKKEKIHPFEPYGKEIRKRKRDGVLVGTSSSRLRVLSGHGNGCQLFFSFPPLRSVVQLHPLPPPSLSLFLSFSRPSAWIPFDRREGGQGGLHFFPFVESFLERQPPLWYTRDSHSRNTE